MAADGALPIEANRARILHPSSAAFAGAMLGCLATLLLGAFGLAPPIASALVTAVLCGHALVRRASTLPPGEFYIALYGGSFAGMTPVLWLIDGASAHSVLPVGALFVALSILCGLVFAIVAEIDGRSRRRLAHGFGGRAGAVATIASLLFLALARLLGADAGPLQAALADAFDSGLTSPALSCAACMLGMVATLLALRHPRLASAHSADRTFMAATIALIGLMALQLIDSNSLQPSGAFYAGCFLGMSAPERLKGPLQPVLAAVLLTALLVRVKMLLPGVGGGLGFAAFATVGVLVAFNRTVSWVVGSAPSSASGAAPSDGRGASMRLALALARPAAPILALGFFVLMVRLPLEQPAAVTASMRTAMDGPVPVHASPADESFPLRTSPVIGDSAEPVSASNPGLVDDRKTGMDQIDAAMPAMPVVDRSPAPIEVAVESEDQLFRQFVQWHAARSAARSGAARKNRAHAPQAAGAPAPAAAGRPVPLRGFGHE